MFNNNSCRTNIFHCRKAIHTSVWLQGTTSKTVLVMLLVDAWRYIIRLENPSIPLHLIRQWRLSMCHRAFDDGTLYTCLQTVVVCLIQIPSGDTLFRESLTVVEEL